MYFTQIELHNFGIYKGTHRIDLNDTFESRNVTLIGGMNGRGKTTILDAVFLSFYGKRALEYINDSKKNYDAFLREYINKSATDETTYVSVSFTMDDGTKFKVIRSWHHEGKKAPEKLIVLKDNQEDGYLSENWNFYIEEVLPFGISRFFFFDNEKISQIADDDSFEQIKDSIKAVMGVTIIDKLLEDIQKLVRDKRNSVQTAENADLLEEASENENALHSIDLEISKANLEKARLVPQLEKVQAELEVTEQNFWKQGGNLGVKREEIEKEKAKLKGEENVLKQQIMDLAVNSATPLIMCRDLIKQVYNKAKEDEVQRALRYSEPIINEILERLTKKVEEILPDNEIRAQVKTLIADELADYGRGVGFKDKIVLEPVSLMLIEKLLESGIFEIQSSAANIKTKAEETDNALLQIDAHLSSNAEKSGAVELLHSIRDLERSATTLQGEVDKCLENIQTLENQKSLLESQRQKIIKKLAQIEDTVDDDARIFSYAAKTDAVMNEFRLRLQKKKVQELEENITKCFRQLAQKETIITKVDINPQSLDLTLRDYAGNLLLKSQLSAGEKQMFAISIIWGLALSSGYKLPVLIDTPMARLDSAHRYNFINRYLPNASSQVIVLSTDEEVYGRYLYQIQEHVNSYYTLLYNEQEKCSTIIPGYFEEGKK